MNADELYGEIKAFLKYAGLSFAEMDKVQVVIEDNILHLQYGKYKVQIKPN